MSDMLKKLGLLGEDGKGAISEESQVDSVNSNTNPVSQGQGEPR